MIALKSCPSSSGRKASIILNAVTDLEILRGGKKENKQKRGHHQLFEPFLTQQK